MTEQNITVNGSSTKSVAKILPTGQAKPHNADTASTIRLVMRSLRGLIFCITLWCPRNICLCADHSRYL